MICLGISIGSTRTGVCVTKNGVLVERRMHKYPHTFTDNKARIITKKYRHYIDKYQVTDIVVKIPSRTHQTKAVKLLLHRITTVAEEYRCHFDLTNTFEMKSVTNTHSAEELIHYIIDKYPELSVVYDKDTQIGNNRYKKVFEAVLAAWLHRERRMRKQAQ